jgi:hypothetical protein
VALILPTSGILVEKHLPAEYPLEVHLAPTGRAALPAEYRSKFTWRQLAGLLKRAAEGQQDVSEVSVALKIVLQIEGVTCR